MVLRRLRGGLLSFVGVARFGLDARGVLLRFGEAARIVKTCGRAREWIYFSLVGARRSCRIQWARWVQTQTAPAQRALLFAVGARVRRCACSPSVPTRATGCESRGRSAALDHAHRRRSMEPTRREVARSHGARRSGAANISAVQRSRRCGWWRAGAHDAEMARPPPQEQNDRWQQGRQVLADLHRHDERVLWPPARGELCSVGDPPTARRAKGHARSG